MAVTVRVQSGSALSRRGAIDERAAVRTTINRAVRTALRYQRVREAELSVTLLDDDEVAAMNRDFLQHDGPTDVISFALYEGDEAPVGDVYIGYGQALRQAATHGVDPLEELARLSVHGVLHVLGHDHPAGDRRQSSPMWAAQEEIVAAVFA